MATLAELHEALSSTQVSALIAKRISPRLLDYVRKEDPIEAAFPVQSWDTNIYFWNTANRFPMPQAVVEAPPTSGTGSVSPSQSNYLQTSYPIQHFQVNGDISRFADKVARVSISGLLTLEMQRSARALRWFRTLMLLYGSQTASTGTYRPQSEGLLRQMANSNKIQPLAGLNGTIALQDLDNLIDLVRPKVGYPLSGPDFFFVCSHKMASQINRLHLPNERFSQIVTMAPRRDNGIVGSQVVEVAGGVEVPTYRGIPIVQTPFLSPSATGTMGNVSLSATGADGTLPATAVYYTVDAVSQYGISYPGAAQTITPTLNNHVDITITTPTFVDAFGTTLPIVQYRIYKGTSASNMSLYAVAPATDAADAAVTVVRDFNNTNVVANPGANQISCLAVGVSNTLGNAGTGATGDFPATAPAAGDSETLMLVCRDPEFVTVPTVNDLTAQVLAPVNVRTVQYALIMDFALALRAPLFASALQAAKTQ